MAARFSLPPHVPSAEKLLLCMQCQDVTSTIRGLCIKCGHSSVFLLQEVISGKLHLPELLANDSWIVQVLYNLLIAEEQAKIIEAPERPAV